MVSPQDSQGEVGVSWVRARVSAKEPEISPKRPRCLLEVRHKVTPRCGPGLAAGGLWGGRLGPGAWGLGAMDKLLMGLTLPRTSWGWNSLFASVFLLLQTLSPE